jgi:hypothetical protein
VQTLGLGFGNLILKHFILGAQLVNQGNDLFNLGFEFFKIRIHDEHYRGKNSAWSRTKPLF